MALLTDTGGHLRPGTLHWPLLRVETLQTENLGQSAETCLEQPADQRQASLRPGVVTVNCS